MVLQEFKLGRTHILSEKLVDRSMRITLNDRLQSDSKLKHYSVLYSLDTWTLMSFSFLCNIQKLQASVVRMVMLEIY